VYAITSTSVQLKTYSANVGLIAEHMRKLALNEMLVLYVRQAKLNKWADQARNLSWRHS